PPPSSHRREVPPRSLRRATSTERMHSRLRPSSADEACFEESPARPPPQEAPRSAGRRDALGDEQSAFSRTSSAERSRRNALNRAFLLAILEMMRAAADALEGTVAIGEVLAGKYRVERLLGAGGMGLVVAATHVELDEKVAIKLLLPSAL